MSAAIEPEPTEEEREVILAALADVVPSEQGWGSAALLEAVEDGEAEP